MPKPYTRKTLDLYVVRGLYGGRWEDLTQSDKRHEAVEDLKAYRNNEPGAFRLVKRRERIDNPLSVEHQARAAIAKADKV